jgi:hypothetical protein
MTELVSSTSYQVRFSFQIHGGFISPGFIQLFAYVC